MYDDRIFYEALSVAIYTKSISSHSHSLPFYSVRDDNKMKIITTKNDDVEAIAFSRYENYTTPYMSHINTPKLNMSLQICVNKECIICMKCECVGI